MGMIGIGVGTTHMGRAKTGPDGKVLSTTPAHWEPDPEGGSVAIWPLNQETMKPDGPAEIFGDWDAAGYLAKVVELIQPSRRVNIPDIKAVVQAAVKDGYENFFCEYCLDCNCRYCIINQWKEEASE